MTFRLYTHPLMESNMSSGTWHANSCSVHLSITIMPSSSPSTRKLQRKFFRNTLRRDDTKKALHDLVPRRQLIREYHFNTRCKCFCGRWVTKQICQLSLKPCETLTAMLIYS